MHTILLTTFFKKKHRILFAQVNSAHCQIQEIRKIDSPVLLKALTSQKLDYFPKMSLWDFNNIRQKPGHLLDEWQGQPFHETANNINFEIDSLYQFSNSLPERKPQNH